MKVNFDILIIGGGAAGFFAAAEAGRQNPKASIAILEASNKVLSKVLISGGGRCNVTNRISQPEELARNYPRGHDFLVEPFRQFSSDHTQRWFTERGVRLKTEADGRVFPVSNKSTCIANTFISEVEKYGVDVRLKSRVNKICFLENGWQIETGTETYFTEKLVICSGSNSAIWSLCKSLGLDVTEPVPSLFTLHAQHELIRDHAGISFPESWVKLQKGQSQSGPLLITHQGLSGPAILKLSAWEAIRFYNENYKATLRVNWVGRTKEDLRNAIKKCQADHPKKHVHNIPLFNLSKRFWKRVCEVAQIPEQRNYAEIGKKQVARFEELLCDCPVEIYGKSTFKEEFVTAGGINLNEINPTDFSAKRFKGLYFAGEVLNIDAITGGFNFQAAWTGGYLIGNHI